MDNTYIDLLDFSIYDIYFFSQKSTYVAYCHVSERTRGYFNGQQYRQEHAEENKIPTVQVS